MDLLELLACVPFRLRGEEWGCADVKGDAGCAGPHGDVQGHQEFGTKAGHRYFQHQDMHIGAGVGPCNDANIDRTYGRRNE